MKTIDISEFISKDLRSRSMVGDLLLYVMALEDNEIAVDFGKVEFSTRSFMDEYYNVFVKENTELNGKVVKTVNMPSDLQYMLNVVSKTQTGHKIYDDPKNTRVHYCKTYEELTEVLKKIQCR